MKTNDEIVLNALATDAQALFKLRSTTYKIASHHDWDSALRVPSKMLWREYLAIEQFIDEHLNSDMSRFCPSI